MEEHRKSQSTRRDSSDRRGGHRRSEHRRKQNLSVDIERRKTVDQRSRIPKKRESEKWPRSKRRNKKRAVNTALFLLRSFS